MSSAWLGRGSWVAVDGGGVIEIGTAARHGLAASEGETRVLAARFRENGVAGTGPGSREKRRHGEAW
ncbi:hypothetical protein M0R45_019500 [Rubus argutus]|uniref:Uncharacterized protein n=1 Tax=Rubus argutus TaxID=59490 RepID=A0AAW1X6Y3_RUBAR